LLIGLVLFHPAYVREKIRTSQLINRLQKCAFGEINLTKASNLFAAGQC
jgi:hypothetical protein